MQLLFSWTIIWFINLSWVLYFDANRLQVKCVFAEYKHLSGVDQVRSKKKHLLQLCVSKSRSLLSYRWVNVGLLQSSGLSLTSPSVCFPWVTSATLKALTFTSASATSISTLTTSHISPELQSPMSNCPLDATFTSYSSISKSLLFLQTPFILPVLQ